MWFLQLWLTFAPVADQSAQYLAVTLEKINWLSLIYMVISIPIAFVSSWMLDTFGLRIMVQSEFGVVNSTAEFFCICSLQLFLKKNPRNILTQWAISFHPTIKCYR